MIKFGTDGWRAKIADEFTFDNIKLVALAFSNVLKEKGLNKKGIAVGYDMRFMSEDFAKCAAEVCSSCGIKTYFSKEPLPAPTLSYFVKSKGLGAGIMITASHNPPEWNGFKIKEDFGGSARPEFTKEVEEELKKTKRPKAKKIGKIALFDPKPEYLKHIAKFVNLKEIAKSETRVVFDAMHGSGAHYLKEILESSGKQIEEIRSNRDPLFSGVNPEPIPLNLEELTSYMQDLSLREPEGISVGIALDGDGDRIGCIDPSGQFISSHNIFSLLLYHLYKNKKMKGKVVKTFNISRLVERQALKYKLDIEEVPIGFKHIAERMLREKVLIGGEESGGLGIQGNIPERDGTLCALLLLELMAQEKKTLKQILKGIMDELGYFYYDRLDLTIPRKNFLPVIEDIKSIKSFANRKITKIETLDGVKLNFDDEAWILFRPSGTEPLLRIYAEGRNLQEVELLLEYGRKMFK